MLAERVKDWTKQWREEGLQQGWQQGEAAMLTRQLACKFGVLDAETERRIATADSQQRLRWGERVLSADKLEDVFA